MPFHNQFYEFLFYVKIHFYFEFFANVKIVDQEEMYWYTLDVTERVTICQSKHSQELSELWRNSFT
jgi:hypothetical protein